MGVKQVADRIWLVSFMNYDLGYFDDEDHQITLRDRVYPLLQMWFDHNHNGKAESGELSSLAERGVVSISTDAREMPLQDQFGNQFRYRAKVEVRSPDGTEHVRMAYDVWLTWIDFRLE